MLSFPVLKEMLGEGLSVCSVSESSGDLKGVRGENLYVVSEKMHSLLFALTLQNTKRCDMNIIMWLFFPLACKPHNYIHMHSF